MADEVVLRRVFDAPRELVWRFWTEPERFARWWGKRGWTTPPESVTIDLRPGGTFRWSSVNDEDGSEMAMDGEYVEIHEPVRLVFAGRDPGGRVGTVTFADLGDGRTEMIFHSTGPVSPHALAGMESAFDRLAEALA